MRDDPKKVHRESPETGAGKEEWMPLESPLIDLPNRVIHYRNKLRMQRL
ncbi:hypothetical protein [Mariprofundus erugo]|nr:hypothetical protein [Mariprofundus erugo]